jgi:hypothetical protein
MLSGLCIETLDLAYRIDSLRDALAGVPIDRRRTLSYARATLALDRAESAAGTGDRVTGLEALAKAKEAVRVALVLARIG